MGGHIRSDKKVGTLSWPLKPWLENLIIIIMMILLFWGMFKFKKPPRPKPYEPTIEEIFDRWE